VAAHLAAGRPFEDVGPPVDPATLVRLELPRPTVREGLIVARCVAVDRFGNVELNVGAPHLEEAGITLGTRVEIELARERYYAVAAVTFADVRAGDVVVYEDSYRNVAIAISRGSAAETFVIAPGDRVALRAL
jgi:S-adenosylmethionine hydrolase